MTAPLELRTSYMRRAHDPADVVAAFRRTRREHEQDYGRLEFDTLVGTGLSGALVVPFLGRALRKHWAVVRKPGESLHGPYAVEGVLGARWLFVDDLIDTGASRWRCVKAIREVCGWKPAHPVPELVGTFLYGYSYGRLMRSKIEFAEPLFDGADRCELVRDFYRTHEPDTSKES